MTTPKELQQWLNWHGARLVDDGKIGPATRIGFLSVFSNRNAPAITRAEREEVARSLRISLKQLDAIATVESSGAGFDNEGRPKILFERHKFWQLTNGAYPVSDFNNPSAGGYSQSSWDKLTRAISLDIDAAIAACSWGRFQVMGFNWAPLGYHSPLELAYSTVRDERGHYEALSRFIVSNGLRGAARLLSTNPEHNREFARGYNGQGYATGRYHIKLAEAMR